MPVNLHQLAQFLETYEPVRDFYRGHANAEDGSISLIFVTNKMWSVLCSRRKLIDHLLSDGTFAVS